MSYTYPNTLRNLKSAGLVPSLSSCQLEALNHRVCLFPDRATATEPEAVPSFTVLRIELQCQLVALNLRVCLFPDRATATDPEVVPSLTALRIELQCQLVALNLCVCLITDRA